MKLHKALKIWRIKENIPLKTLAAQIRCSPSTLTRVEKGSRGTTPYILLGYRKAGLTLLEIAKILKLEEEK